MADPISVLAVAGLVYAGRTLSKSKTENYSPEANITLANDSGASRILVVSNEVVDKNYLTCVVVCSIRGV